MPRFLYILFICLGIQISFAQPDQSSKINEPYSIHHYTLKDGLSQVTINDIAEDKNGFIWVATQAGLNRFDGTSFRSYYNKSDVKNSLCGNFINTLLADQDRIWIGTRSSGLCYFDTKEYKFLEFDLLKDYEILDIEMDKNHTLFAAVSDKGIAAIKKGENDDYRLQFLDFFLKKNVNATEIYISKKGTLWIGTKEGRIFYGEIRNDPGQIIFKELPLGQKFEKINIINTNSDEFIWIGTDQNLFQIDLRSNMIFPVNFNILNRKASSIIYDLQWKNNYLWVATGEGLFKYDTKDHRITESYYHNELSKNSLSNNSVNTLLVDSNDQLWVGTGKYLNLFYKSNIFHNITHDSGNKNSLNSNIIFSILKDKKDLWIGTSGGGINLLRDGQYYFFTKSTHKLPSNVCFSLLKDSVNLWAGTKEGLVILQNFEKSYPEIKSTIVLHNPKDQNSLKNNFVRYLYKDRNGKIWVCTNGGGLNLYTGNIYKHNFSFKSYTHQYEDEFSIASDKVKYITQIDKNSYWVGTNKGLNVLSFKDRDLLKPAFKRLMIKDSAVLTNNVIYNILKDKDSGVWIGTTQGIYFYNLISKDLKLIKQKNDLNNNVIYSLLKDPQNNIWYSTNKGLSHYDRITKIYTNYNQNDGISSEEFDLNARYNETNGTLYFGGINGITYFNPGEVVYSPYESKLYIDNIQITNSKQNTIEKLQIRNNQHIRIKSRQFPFYVNFSDINLNYYKNTEFAYRLKPEDKNWNLIHNKRQIQFLSLAPGTYTLEIQGLTKGVLWKKNKPISLKISVIPLWWQSQFAYLLYLLLFLLLLYSIYHYTLKRKLEHQENLRLLELDDVKTKLYGNITHELRTPLTVIMGMTENIKQLLEPQTLNKVGLKLDILSRNTKKLLFLINQMLNLSKIESGNLDLNPVQTDIIPFIKVSMESFQTLAANKNIELIFYNEEDKIIMDFDPDKISAVISNLLSNAIKYTPENGRIIVHIKRSMINSKPFFILKIRDNGIGIQEVDQEHIFDRFYQVNHSHMGGTGIGLSLTRELVLLMNGQISVKSKLNEGTAFIVEIPVTHNAEKPEETPLNPAMPLIDSDIDTEEDTDHHHHLEGLPQILIIEDHKDVAHYIASGLIDQYEILFAQDGKEGIEKALENIPDLIITDLMMPKADGFEVCDTLKNDEKTSHIPIIMLTARTFEKDKIRGLAYGADAYLTKPFNQDELLVRIEQLILQRKKLQEKYQKTGIIHTQSSSAEKSFINKCIQIIHQHLDDESFKSSSLSFHVNLSESQLYRKLKAITGLSTALFIRDIRLIAAREMIQKTRLNISEIAYACGFSSPDWFSKSFKEKYGYSPTDYRERYH